MADDETRTDTDAPDPEPGSEPEKPESPSTEEVPRQLPDDHPLVKALASIKEERNELRDKVNEFEDAQKTEAEKAAEARAEAERTAEKATREAARLRIALSKGLTGDQALTFAKRLTGDTEEELEADADELIEFFSVKEDGKPRRPKEKLKPGASPDGEPQPDPRKLADSIFTEGRF